MALPLALTIGGTADITQTYTPNAATGKVVVDWPLTPWGDITQIAGTDLALQRVGRFFYAPYGSDPLHPRYGSLLWGVLLTPLAATGDAYAGTVLQDQTNFLRLQAAEQTAGTLTTDELVAYFDQTTIAIVDMALNVSMWVVTQSGVAQQTTITVAGG